MTTEADRIWQVLVGMVIDTRGDWRRRVSEATGLPFTRLRALRRIGEEPMTLSALAHSMSTDAPAATVTVNDLERRGLVTREEHPDDRRAKLVTITAAGRAILRTYKSVSDHAPEPLASLSPADLKILARLVAGGATENSRTTKRRK
jgi:DNA-binding MarR family transcriptional regulator